MLDLINRFRACDVVHGLSHATSHATSCAPTWRFTVSISCLDECTEPDRSRLSAGFLAVDLSPSVCHPWHVFCSAHRFETTSEALVPDPILTVSRLLLTTASSSRHKRRIEMLDKSKILAMIKAMGRGEKSKAEFGLRALDDRSGYPLTAKHPKSYRATVCQPA